MPRLITRLVRTKYRILCFAIILSIAWFAHTTRLAMAAKAQVGCSSLTAAPATDNPGYILTATSFGDSSTITGYKFNFGDNQSYVFAFDSASTQNRNQVTVTHIYASQGVYNATVYVETRHGSKTSDNTSTSCSTAIADGLTTLLNTGAGNTVELFIIAFVVGLIAYEIWLRAVRVQRRTRF